MKLLVTLNHRQTLQFDILQNPITDLWLEKMSVRNNWNLDNPNRFYNFNDKNTEERVAKEFLNNCINTINDYKPIIERPFTSIYDQDYLNYCHNIFETHHGMLDQQQNALFNHSPDHVKKALADLNIAVHKCESLAIFRPRFVCTWYGSPKDKVLPVDLQKQHASRTTEFGGVYLNYCEIGKTAWELARDNDEYAGHEMFRPFSYYSSDFVVKLFEESMEEFDKKMHQVKEYFHKRKDYFISHGITSFDDFRMQPVQYKVAQLDYTNSTKEDIIETIRNNQTVTEVNIQ